MTLYCYFQGGAESTDKNERSLWKVESWWGRIRVQNSRGARVDSHRTEKLPQIYRMGRGRLGRYNPGLNRIIIFFFIICWLYCRLSRKILQSFVSMEQNWQLGDALIKCQHRNWMRLLLIIGGWERNPFNDMDHLTNDRIHDPERFKRQLLAACVWEIVVGATSSCLLVGGSC